MAGGQKKSPVSGALDACGAGRSLASRCGRYQLILVELGRTEYAQNALQTDRHYDVEEKRQKGR